MKLIFLLGIHVDELICLYIIKHNVINLMYLFVLWQAYSNGRNTLRVR